MNSPHNLQQYTRTRNAISSLLVSQLKTVLREEKLPLYGAKAVLIERVENRLEQYYTSNDVTRLNRLSAAITQPNAPSTARPSPTTSMVFQNHTPTNSTAAGSAAPSSYGTPASWHRPSNGAMSAQLTFKESPFYRVQTQLSAVQTLKAVETGRATHEFSCKIPADWAANFERDALERDLYRVMLMGACDPASQFMKHDVAKQDVAFPPQFEVKINGSEVRWNWKGLKNKIGSTRPADVTEFLRKSNGYDNTITVTWALTAKKFYVRLDLVKQKTLTSMIQALREKPNILRAQVLRDMRSKAQDSDIVATSTIMSLKCPLSYTRLKDPCRGGQCNHNQCFDATSYLQLQQQAPTWTCPICNKLATYETLQIDEYVADILARVTGDVEQVTITPEGEWSKISASQQDHNQASPPSVQGSVEELDDTSDPESYQVSEATRNGMLNVTTPLAAQKPPVESNSARNSTRKRPHEVVDLTLDSSEDESPAPKRVSMPTHSSAPQYTSRLINFPLTNPSHTPSRGSFSAKGSSMPLPQSFGSLQG